MVGKSISYFEILEELGRGGMGVVFKAKDTRLNRIVALKVLPPAVLSSEDARLRFYREAQAAAQLHHTHIATIFSIEEGVFRTGGNASAVSDGESGESRPVIAMEYIEGVSLEDRIEQGPLAIDEAIRIAGEIASALQVAHDAGVVHRDIKSANVMLTSEGAVKVVDFGLAKTSDSTTITQQGSTLGTFAYMSPEQGRSENVDHRTDIWSLGVILYEMIAGKRPFRGDYEAAVVYSVGNEDPEPLTGIRTGVPIELEQIVSRALAKKPEDRYQSAQELLISLRLLSENEHPRQVAPAPVTEDSKRKFPVGMVAAILGIVIIVVAGIQIFGGSSEGHVIDSIAVLPLRNASNDPEQEFFADGLTEELIVALAGVDGLNVAARTSSFAFKGREVSIQEVGNTLGVQSILEGSIRKSGDLLRIVVHLSEVATGFELWSEIYDGQLSDVFEVQESIATEIMEALRFELGADVAEAIQPATENVEAYEAYMKGRFFWAKRTDADVRLAVEYFEEAIEKEPTYARAHAGLADAYNIQGFYDWGVPGEIFPKARAAAERALELDPTLAEAHNSLGYTAVYFDWDAEQAEREFLRALELNPDYPVARQWYGNFLVAAGRFEDAYREMERATELDPLAAITKGALAWAYYHAREMDSAVRVFAEVLEFQPEFPPVLMWKSLSHLGLGEVDMAKSEIAAAVEHSGRDPGVIAVQTYIMAVAGEEAAARNQLALLEAEREERYIPSYELAKIYVALGDHDQALELLEESFADQAHAMVFLKVDPALSDLQDDPRFLDLVERVGFNIQ